MRTSSSHGPLVLGLLAAACVGEPNPQTRARDPAQVEVPLACAEGWDARLIYATDVGIWTVRSFQLQPEYGCPEVVGLDDRGRCTVLRSYSGKWTPLQTVADGMWLAPVAWGDVDPRLDGAELYASGQRGFVYRIRPRARGGFDSAVVAEFPGEEVHTLLAGDLRPERPGDELLVFTLGGELFELQTEGEHLGCRVRRLAQLPGRVRDAVVPPAARGESPWIATVSRAQEVALLRLRPEEVDREVVLREPMGFGRIALRAGPPPVLYVTRDDGLVLRLERRSEGEWKREIVYAGPQGPRGLAAGRFHEDPERECLAVFGYSKRVQLLSRRPGRPWEVETIFTDVDRGHWLTTAELDGRNATVEIVGSGYGGRIFLLSRPPGYGLGAEIPLDEARLPHVSDENEAARWRTP